MSEQFETVYFRGQGPLMIADRDQNGNPLGFEFVGDLGSVTLTPNIERYEMIETVSGKSAVGVIGKKRAVYNVSISFRSVKPGHLAQILQGSAVAIQANSATRTLTAHHDKFIKLSHVNTWGLTVTGPGGTPTYANDDDYVYHYEEGMVEILSTGAIPDGATIEVNYSFGGQTQVKANPGNIDKYLLFSGINTANDDKVARVELFKVKLDPGAMDLISDEPTEMEVSGTLMLDTTRTAGDQLFRVTLQN